jgi:hypothetical protein
MLPYMPTGPWIRFSINPVSDSQTLENSPVSRPVCRLAGGEARRRLQTGYYKGRHGKCRALHEAPTPIGQEAQPPAANSTCQKAEAVELNHHWQNLSRSHDVRGGAWRLGSRQRTDAPGLACAIWRSADAWLEKHAADLEQEMLKRGMFFEVIDWSEGQTNALFEE